MLQPVPAEGKSCVSSGSDGTSGPVQGDPTPTRRTGTRTSESDEEEQQRGDEEEQQEGGEEEEQVGGSWIEL